MATKLTQLNVQSGSGPETRNNKEEYAHLVSSFRTFIYQNRLQDNITVATVRDFFRNYAEENGHMFDPEKINRLVNYLSSDVNLNSDVVSAKFGDKQEFTHGEHDAPFYKEPNLPSDPHGIDYHADYGVERDRSTLHSTDDMLDVELKIYNRMTSLVDKMRPKEKRYLKQELKRYLGRDERTD
jgi:hypothetical protein